MGKPNLTTCPKNRKHYTPGRTKEDDATLGGLSGWIESRV
jgi:hypothetical protein